jgi:AP-3 complex subunit mu
VFSIARHSLIYLACSSREAPPLLIFEFLHRVADIFASYFGVAASSSSNGLNVSSAAASAFQSAMAPPGGGSSSSSSVEGGGYHSSNSGILGSTGNIILDDSCIKENFTTVYQLLEEMVDNGWPLTTEPNALEAMIPPPTVLGAITRIVTGSARGDSSSTLPDSGTVSKMPWRKSNVRYAQNEIYVDIVEEIDAIMSPNGSIISSDVSGSIQAQSKLSGVPDLTLIFTNPDVIDDCSFHPCVRFNRYERDKVISFIPPDGNFELMKYRIKTNSLNNNNANANNNNNIGGFSSSNSNPEMISAPIFCTPSHSYEDPQGGGPAVGRISVVVGMKANHSLNFPKNRGAMIVEDVVVTIPFPRVVRTAVSSDNRIE